MRKLIPLSGAASLLGLLTWLIVFASQPASVEAFPNGMTGVSRNGCGSCHGPGADPNVAVAISGPTTLAPGSTSSYTVTVSGNPTGSMGLGGGLDVSVTGGTLAAGANNQLAGGEIT